MIKRFVLWVVAWTALFLAGCTSGGKTVVVFDGLEMSIPNDMAMVSNASFDSYQIINKVLKVYKIETETLVVARSALTANLTSDAYAQTSKEKIVQGVPGYEFIDDGTVSFTCGDEKIQGYTHTFAINDAAQENPGKTYIMQYYFIAQGTPYIISQADRTSDHYSDFTSTINSLHCRS